MKGKQNSKGLFFFTLSVSLAIGYMGNAFALHVAKQEGNIISKLSTGIDTFLCFFNANPIVLTFTKNSIVTGLILFMLVWLFYLYHTFGSKKYMRGIEHGSAEWGSAYAARQYMDKKNKYNNIILSQSEYLRLTGRNSFEYDRNKNVVIIGGSGSGKTRNVAKPNLMQLHSSYVVTDPKGTLLPETGNLFLRNGYKLKILNTINFLKSMHYNPLAYIHSEKDILKLVNVLMENTKGEGTQAGDDFWVKAERLWYMACISYLYYEANYEDRHIPMLINMLDLSQAKEDNEDFASPVDVLFDDLEKKKGNCFPVSQYKKFKQAAGKTLKSILISCAARLAPFEVDGLKETLMYDELELDKIGDRKTIFYVIMSDTDDTFKFIIAMCFYQMFNLLCEHADDECGGSLPVHVRCILDEFANIGKIPNFEKLISTIRSREISATIMLQSMSQLEAQYKESAETILDCCDTLVFLGGKSTKTTKALSEMMGKGTIDNTNINESKGQTGSYTINNSNLGRDLLDPAEVGKLNRSECIVQITGEEPFRSQKYDVTNHDRYKYLSDYDEKNKFNYETFLRAPDSELREGMSFLDIGEIKINNNTDLSELNVLAG